MFSWFLQSHFHLYIFVRKADIYVTMATFSIVLFKPEYVALYVYVLGYSNFKYVR